MCLETSNVYEYKQCPNHQVQTLTNKSLKYLDYPECTLGLVAF
jgi:hypothetical protein